MDVIDNFDKIKDLLQFSGNGDLFYFIQIIKRKKENRDLGCNNKTVNVYFVNNMESFDKIKTFVKQDCVSHNARAYINLNPLSYKKVAFGVNSYIAECLEKGDYFSVKNAFTTVCGRIKCGIGNRIWIIDVDEKELDYVREMITVIKTLQVKPNRKNDVKYKVLEILPTLNGFHIITNPFDVIQFGKVYPNIDIHKNNPTILYHNHNYTPL